MLQVNPGGFAFVKRGGGETSIFIPPHRIGGAIDGDEVEVAHWPAERGLEGRVEKIVRRGRTRIAGIMIKVGGGSWRLDSEDPRLLPTVRVRGRVRPEWSGQVVAGRVVTYPDAGEGEITVELERVLGVPGELRTEVEKILIEQGVPAAFPEPVEAEAALASDIIGEADFEGRVDLRQLPWMTIDPEDARDFDDAVHVEAIGDAAPEVGDVRLYVAVADVSHYVREGTQLDIEASERGFSCYLPNRAPSDVAGAPQRRSVFARAGT